jgi:hypothetical protein
VTSTWSRSSGFDHGAVVQRENPLYPTGTRLAERPLYFTNVSPVLDATYAVGYDASDSGSVDVAVTLRLVIESVGDAEEGGTPLVYWRTVRPLDQQRASGVSPGENVTVPVSVDTRDVGDRIERIEEGLNATAGTPGVRVVADVNVTGRANGRPVDRQLRQQLGVDLAEGYYRVSGGETNTTRRETTTTVTVPRTYGPVRRVGAPLLTLLGLVGLVGLEVARRRGRLGVDEREREWLTYRGDRSEFEEWIHRVDLPSEAEDLPRASASSLADLVDLAIDADAPVLWAPEGETYRVVHDGYVYVYEAPDLGADAASAAERSDGSDGDGVLATVGSLWNADASEADDAVDAMDDRTGDGESRSDADTPADREE